MNQTQWFLLYILKSWAYHHQIKPNIVTITKINHQKYRSDTLLGISWSPLVIPLVSMIPFLFLWSSCLLLCLLWLYYCNSTFSKHCTVFQMLSDFKYFPPFFSKLLLHQLPKSVCLKSHILRSSQQQKYVNPIKSWYTLLTFYSKSVKYE